MRFDFIKGGGIVCYTKIYDILAYQKSGSE